MNRVYSISKIGQCFVGSGCYQTQVNHDRCIIQITCFFRVWVYRQHTVMNIFESLDQHSGITNAIVIENSDALNLCVGSKIKNDTSYEDAMVLHRETNRPPTNLLTPTSFSRT